LVGWSVGLFVCLIAHEETKAPMNFPLLATSKFAVKNSCMEKISSSDSYSLKKYSEEEVQQQQKQNKKMVVAKCSTISILSCKLQVI
jgi:hypothetical protein